MLIKLQSSRMHILIPKTILFSITRNGDKR